MEALSPSKSSFEARLVEVDEQSCDTLSNLHATINGGLSPRTDPNCSSSPCHSTYASPTHSESVDLPDMFSRHQLASPTGSSVSSFNLNSGLYMSNPTHTTLKKRWLLQYANEGAANKVTPRNGVITTNVYRPSQILRVAVSPKTFPLPYKRRKLIEYQKSVNNSTSQTAVKTTLQISTGENLTENAATVSSTVNASTSISSTVTSSSTTSFASLMTSPMASPPMTSPVTSSLTSVNVTSLNNLTSTSTSEVRLTMLASTRTSTSGVLTVTGSNDAVFPRVTGSEEASWRRRISGGSDEISVGRSSLSSISSTDDIKMDATGTSSDSAKIELNLGNAVGSSSEANRKPPFSQAVQENSLESSTDCITRDDNSRDKTAHVGSSGVVEGAASTTQTTPGGKKKVSLTEYLSRKRTTGSTVKKEAAPGPSSSDVTSADQSRVSDSGSLLASSDPVSSVVKYRGSLGTSVSTSGYGSTLLPTTGVSSSTSGIEPVSPEEGYRVDDDRPSLSSNVHGLQSSSTVEREAKPSLMPTSSYRSYSQNLPLRPVSEPGSSSDAMDIDDDDVPSSSTIVVNTPVMSLPGARSVGVTSSDMMSSLAGKSYSNIGQPIKFNNVTSAQPLPGRQVTNSMVPPENIGRQLVPVSQVPNTSLQPLPRHHDFRSASGRPSPFH
ncbi:Hypothetical predicted protein [Paramuricea clavata]|uniref:Uncharacterized protein n=1 Tax=Paramuricea clavata TaxID=317549 RepID=A0A6S7JJM2_PARCT|nr:Hypothetical predicted protein [Paramuricea clavata]